MVTIFKFQILSHLPKKLQERYLEYFSISDDKEVRRNVAINPNTPAHVLEKLSVDKYWSVRYNVAKHPNAPSHVLERLIEIKDCSPKKVEQNLDNRK